MDRSTTKASGSKASNSDPPSPQPIRVIQELYQDYNDIGYKQALTELDNALEEECQHIVIEPMKLGDETMRWIAVGNFLHKSTVITGACTLVAIGLSNTRWYLWSPLAASTSLTFAAYSLLWQPDKCCKYQVEKDQETLASLDISNVNTHSVVVLTFRDDSRRRVLHTGVFVTMACVVGFTIFDLWSNGGS